MHFNFHFAKGEVVIIAQRLGLHESIVYYLNVFVAVSSSAVDSSTTGLLGHTCGSLPRNPTVQLILDKQQIKCTQAQPYGAENVPATSFFSSNIPAASQKSYDCGKYDKLTALLKDQLDGVKTETESYFIEDEFDLTLYQAARSWCAEHFVTSLNASCIIDALLTCPPDNDDFFSCTTRALAQDYHRFESLLRWVQTRFNDTIIIPEDAFTIDEPNEVESSSLGLVLQWGSFALLVIVVTFLIYKYWKRRSSSSSSPQHRVRFTSSPASYKMQKMSSSSSSQSSSQSSLSDSKDFLDNDDVEEFI